MYRCLNLAAADIAHRERDLPKISHATLMPNLCTSPIIASDSIRDNEQSRRHH